MCISSQGVLLTYPGLGSSPACTARSTLLPVAHSNIGCRAPLLQIPLYDALNTSLTRPRPILLRTTFQNPLTKGGHPVIKIASEIGFGNSIFRGPAKPSKQLGGLDCQCKYERFSGDGFPGDCCRWREAKGIPTQLKRHTVDETAESPQLADQRPPRPGVGRATRSAQCVP